MKVSHEKAHGIHYTPTALAKAVAKRIAQELVVVQGSELRIADPACGDGELLLALVNALNGHRSNVKAFAFDLDAQAVETAGIRLSLLVSTEAKVKDFLIEPRPEYQSQLFVDECPATSESFDTIIANPPYVRTQVLGSKRAQLLAERYGLRGRVDLAYAFVIAIVEAVRHGGYFAIIVSNKFLTIKAGAALREFLQAETELLEIWDLGDSRLFSAAVLPAVIFGRRGRGNRSVASVPFRSLYAGPIAVEAATVTALTDDEALEAFCSAENPLRLQWRESLWNVRVGHVAVQRHTGSWILEDEVVRATQTAIRKSRVGRFVDVLRTSVGVKTTADSIFIRNDWEQLPKRSVPENDLLWPIRMTADIERWTPPAVGKLCCRILYPYLPNTATRTLVDLAHYPGAVSYLEQYRAKLEARQYVVESGRQWFEPWVPQQPRKWALPRLVFRDIAAQSTFCVDLSGAIPNGTLFWAIQTAERGSADILWAACAIANCQWTGEYYDLVLGTRLYAGRRRYNTQAVNEFLFPREDHDIRELSSFARDAAQAVATSDPVELLRIEREIDTYCRALFSQSSEYVPAAG